MIRARRNSERANHPDPLRACVGIAAVELVRLLALIADSDISELDVTTQDTRLSVRRQPIGGRLLPTSGDGSPQAAESGSLAITSPLVGIFRPSVAPGESVQPGQSIGAIEALGMPTNVDAPQSGTVEDLLVQDGSPVEYGQPLLILRCSTHEP